MKDQLIALSAQVVALLVPVIAALIIALISKGISWLGTKTKNEAAQNLLQQLGTTSYVAVNAAAQIAAENLRAKSTVNDPPPSAEALNIEKKETALRVMKDQLGPAGLKQVSKTLGLLTPRDLENLLSNQIEAQVHQSKPKSPTGGAA